MLMSMSNLSNLHKYKPLKAWTRPAILIVLVPLLVGGAVFIVTSMAYLYKDWVVSHDRLNQTSAEVARKVDMNAHKELITRI